MPIFIDSHTTEGVTYEVRLTATGGTCTCPDHLHRQRECRHIQQARAERAARLAAKAKALSDAELEVLRVKYSRKDPVIWVAILGEIHDREQFAQQQAELKALFA